MRIQLLYPPRLDGATKQVLGQSPGQPHTRMQCTEDDSAQVQLTKPIKRLGAALVDSERTDDSARSQRNVPAMLLSFKLATSDGHHGHGTLCLRIGSQSNQEQIEQALPATEAVSGVRVGWLRTRAVTAHLRQRVVDTSCRTR